jgi:outer membrane protein insertion porin family
MKKLAGLLIILSIFPSFTSGQDAKSDKVVVFPFRIISSGKPVTLSNELSAVLGAELGREGDIESVAAGPFASVVQETKIDNARISRICDRIGASASVVGNVSKLEDGYSLDLTVIFRDPRKKVRSFSATGKNMEEVVNRLKDLASEVGGVVSNRPKIGAIKIEGNRRIQREAILNRLNLKTGGPFRRSAVSDDIREIYSMGYFDDVQIKADDTDQGQIELKITVKERPSIKNIEIEGNKLFSKDEILDTLTTKSFSVASVSKIRDDISKIKQLYEKSGYYQPKIEYEIKEVSRDEATLVFKIDEGPKSYLTEVVLEGRSKIPEKDLKKIMNIKEKTWFWLLDESGTFTREKLEENRMRLMAYYLDNGFVNVQVGEPEVKIDGSNVKLAYPIREGERFQIRKINVEGDLVMPEEQVLSYLQTKPKTWFKRSSLAEDLKNITRLYNNLGYAYADVEPKQKINDKYKFVDLTFNVTKGQRVSIEKVDIVGNDRTRDKIIRRALSFGEGDLYNADRIEASKNNLEGMDFFEAVRIKTAPGSKPDLMTITVEVMEKKTGSLAAGLGYSSQDGAMGNLNLKERNLLGMGIIANAKANLSGRRNNYEGSLTYPWMFDYPITGSVNGHQAQQKETHYVRDGDGFGVNIGYPLYGLWSMSAGFSRDSTKITNFEQMFAYSVVDYYRRYGTSAHKFLNISENSLSLNFNRDTRNSSVIPTGGSKISIGGRVSGLGGDVAFSTYFSEALYYYPLFWRTVIKFRANGSILMESGNDPIPFDRRITLGGIQSIRGYRQGDIGPKDRFGNIIGGDRSFFGNIEYLFPLIDQLKMSGVAFVDAGNAWNVSDGPFFNDVKAGVGVGIRWVSPMGPIRVEYGWKINPAKGEDPGAFAFAMGQLF